MSTSSVLVEPPAVLPRQFYGRNTAVVGRELLGMILRVKDGHVWRSGIIVEDEAYVSDDPASHAYHGPNRRNHSMFKEPGTAYVYRIHQAYCVNAVTVEGEAVLIRSLQPVENVSLSTIGPGRLCRALGITKERHDGLSFTGGEVQIVDHDFGRVEVGVSERIGISKARELPLRFFVKNNRFVSRGRSLGRAVG